MQEGGRQRSLRKVPFSLARGWGSGGKTDENLKAVYKYIDVMISVHCLTLSKRGWRKSHIKSTPLYTNYLIFFFFLDIIILSFQNHITNEFLQAIWLLLYFRAMNKICQSLLSTKGIRTCWGKTQVGQSDCTDLQYWKKVSNCPKF